MTLKSKISACVLLCVLLIAAGALVNQSIMKKRYHYNMRPPIPEGAYEIHSNFIGDKNGLIYSPYLPREYIRIVPAEKE